MRNRERIAEELEHLRHRRDVLNERIEKLEKVYAETENAEILNLVHSYALSPEELAKLISRLKTRTPGVIDKEE